MGKVLVTGGGGFIGAALVRELARRGLAVRSFDNGFRKRDAGEADGGGDVEYVAGDIRDVAAVRRAMRGVEAVFHLAYVNGTAFFYSQPRLVLDVAIRGQLAALDCAEEAGVETFVYFSSSEAYQTPTVIPTPEDVPLVVPDVHNPRYSYGGGKILAEMLLLHYARPAGMRRLVIRPHNVYGPAMGFEHVIPQLVERIYRASDGLRLPEASIVLQGTGQETRAFCHVDDAVAGTLLAFEKGADGTVYHLGNPVETTILELLRRIGERCGVRVRPETGEAPAGATPRRCPDVSRLAALGYVPRVDLVTGLAGTVDWYAAYFRDRAGLPGGRDDKGAH